MFKLLPQDPTNVNAFKENMCDPYSCKQISNVMTSIITLRKRSSNLDVFTQNMRFLINFNVMRIESYIRNHVFIKLVGKGR